MILKEFSGARGTATASPHSRTLKPRTEELEDLVLGNKLEIA
jgi:hypothetical protein